MNKTVNKTRKEMNNVYESKKEVNKTVHKTIEEVKKTVEKTVKETVRIFRKKWNFGENQGKVDDMVSLKPNLKEHTPLIHRGKELFPESFVAKLSVQSLTWRNIHHWSIQKCSYYILYIVATSTVWIETFRSILHWIILEWVLHYTTMCDLSMSVYYTTLHYTTWMPG